MSKTQLIILWIGIAIIVLMGLFPPEESYTGLSRRGGHTQRHGGGYDFILNVRGISFSLLFVQWAIVTLITGGLIYSLKVDPELLMKFRCFILRWVFSKQTYEELLKSEREKRKPPQENVPPESPG